MKHIAREVPMTQRPRGRGASRVVFISNNVSVSEVKIRIDILLSTIKSNSRGKC